MAGLAGCQTPARIVEKGPDSITVAIPENTNDWPTHYRAAADALAKEKLGTYIAVNEREVATGGINAAAPSANATPASKEYRITYQKKPSQPAVPLGSTLPTAVGARPTPNPATGLGAGVQPANATVPAGAYTPGGMTGANATQMGGAMGSTVPQVGPGSAYPFATPNTSYNK